MAPAPFDQLRNLGGLEFDPSGDMLSQAKEHAEVISKKLADDEQA